MTYVAPCLGGVSESELRELQALQELEWAGQLEEEDCEQDKRGLWYRTSLTGWQLLVPKEWRERVMTISHALPWRGHLGRDKTWQAMRHRFFWEGMRAEIAEFVKKCVSCSRRRPVKTKTPIQMPPLPERALELVSMDIVGPLPTTQQGNRYLLTMVDHLTRYAEAVAIPDQSARTVSRAFVSQWVTRHGPPGRLLTDQGRNFISELLQDVCRVLGVHKLRTTAYHPQCNGVVERFHGTLMRIVRHFVRKDGRDWDRWVPYALMAYRSTQHSATGHSPQYLLTGQELDLPGEGWVGPDHAHGHEGAEQLANRLEQSRRAAQSQIRAEWKRRATRCNRRRKLLVFQPGDGVYLHHPVRPGGVAAKFHCPWTGPHTVLERLSRVDYRLQLAHGGREVVHVERLKPSYEGGYSSEEGDDESAGEDGPNPGRESVESLESEEEHLGKGTPRTESLRGQCEPTGATHSGTHRGADRPLTPPIGTTTPSGSSGGGTGSGGVGNLGGGEDSLGQSTPAGTEKTPEELRTPSMPSTPSWLSTGSDPLSRMPGSNPNTPETPWWAADPRALDPEGGTVDTPLGIPREPTGEGEQGRGNRRSQRTRGRPRRLEDYDVEWGGT